MPKPDLYYLMYRDPVYIAVVRLIGYQGIDLKDAQAQADGLVKTLAEKLPQLEKKEIQHRVNSAIIDLTVDDKRAQQDIRLELTAEARKIASQILGVPPEHEDYPFYEAQRKRWRERIELEKASELPVEQSAGQPKKRARKGRGK